MRRPGLSRASAGSRPAQATQSQIEASATAARCYDGSEAKCRMAGRRAGRKGWKVVGRRKDLWLLEDGRSGVAGAA